MPTSVYFNNQGASREQMLLEDMVIESIKNHGIDIYYIPRESQSEFDELFGDDPVKAFYKAFPIDVYLETFNDFEGNQEFFSKFGLEVQKTARFAVARRTFERMLPSGVRIAPKEGDLIWMPVQHKLMEIKFVEQEINFFQFGKGANPGTKLGGSNDGLNRFFPYMYGLSVELFKYNGEIFDTGIIDVDEVQNNQAYAIDLTLQVGGAGAFREFEPVYQGASLGSATARAICAEWDAPQRILKLRNIKGNFTGNTMIRGAVSLATWFTSGTIDTMENANDPYEDNVRIENEADNILDWTETNPFGSANET